MVKRTLPEALKEYQWKPGQSGNPKGRPKRLTLEEQVYKVLDEEQEGTGGWDRHEALARVIVDMMLKRNPTIIKEYLARAWPQVQRHEHAGDGGGPIEIVSGGEWASLARALPSVGEGPTRRRVNGNGAAKPNGNGAA
jgi:hypothetical protein